MSYHTQIDQQFLPLDSSIKASSVPQYSTNHELKSDSLYGQDSDVSFLMSKISELQKNYIQLQKRYSKKIKDLKQELFQKHQTQSTLNQQLSILSKQYEQHKNQIQKISYDIKKALQQALNQQSKQIKLKSVSPKNQKHNSPKRVIKKSLQIVKKQAIQPTKHINISISQSHNLMDNTIRSQKSHSNAQISKDFTDQHKKMLIKQDNNLKSSNENSLNSSNQTTNGRKVLYSPKSSTNGPSPKKKLLFNSSKQLDLFSKPLQQNKTSTTGKNSSPRRINISPTHKKKQIVNLQIKIDQNDKKIQFKNQLTTIQQIPNKHQVKQVAKEKNSVSNSGQLPSPSGRKKASSPESVGFLRKKISSKKIQIQVQIQHKKQSIKQQIQLVKRQIKNQECKKQDYEANKIASNSSKTLGQLKIQVNQKKPQKKLNQSPSQSNKNIKISPSAKFSPSTKFSPARKTLQYSPSHKKGLAQIFESKNEKPKTLTNMRQKIDENIFK